jgi:hypothetical protein
MKPLAPSVPDIAFVMIAPIFAIRGAVRLTQSDGDLAGHIRMGWWILAHHQLPAHSLASYTAAAEPLISPGWLSEILFALLFDLGGLPLIAVVTGIVIGLTHALLALFLRRRGVDPRLVMTAVLASLFLASSHWLARPHMFTILGAALTLWLLESRNPRRLALFLPLFALWANLHGGWLYGLLLIAVYAAGNLAEAGVSADKPVWLSRARADAKALVVSAGAALLNPYGLRLYGEVIGAVTSVSLADRIDEYRAPDFHEFASLPFLLAILGCVALLALTRRRLSLPRLGAVLMSLFFALKADRNIALFGVTAVPLLTLHASDALKDSGLPFPWFRAIADIDARTRPGLWAAVVAGMMLALGLNRGSIGSLSLIADRFDPRRFPVEAVDRARATGLHGRVFHPWLWGGYLMYSWPEARLHVDPLKFSQLTMDSHTIIESTLPGWQAELDRWKVALVLAEPGSRLDSALSRDPRWSSRYRDRTAVLLERRSAFPDLPSRGR